MSWKKIKDTADWLLLIGAVVVLTTAYLNQKQANDEIRAVTQHIRKTLAPKAPKLFPEPPKSWGI